MSTNINKLQSGGGFGMLFSGIANPYARQNQQVAPSSTSASQSNSSDILNKETLSALRIQGLPNEVEEFEYKLANLQKRIAMGLPVNSQTLAALRSDANRIIKQSDYLKDAFDVAKKNETLGDIAVDQNGFIYARDSEGKVQKVQFKKYDASRYTALTYSELIEYRRNSPEAINDADIIKTIVQSVGTEQINKFIQDILTKIGTTETKQEAYQSLKNMLGTAQAGQLTQEKYAALKNVAIAADQIGLDAIFKTGEYSKNSNIQQALRYIMQIMPKKMQAQLQGNFIAQGGEYKNSGEYIYDVISNAVLSKSSSDYAYTINYDSAINTAAGTKAGKASTKSYNKGPLEIFFDGNLNRQNITLSDPTDKNKTLLIGKGNTLGVITDDSGKAITNLPLSAALNLSMQKYLDSQHVYIGDSETTMENLQNIVYGSDKIAQVMMPTLQDGSIDWKGVHAYALAEKSCQEQGITDPRQKNEIHALVGSNIRFNDDGSIVQTAEVQPYFMTFGFTAEKNAEKSNYNIELDGQSEDAADALIKSVYKNNISKQMGLSGMAEKHWWSDIVKVPIFIKVSPTAASDARIYAKHGPVESNSHTEEDYMLQQQLTQPVQEEDTINANSQLLYTTE